MVSSGTGDYYAVLWSVFKYVVAPVFKNVYVLFFCFWYLTIPLKLNREYMCKIFNQINVILILKLILKIDFK